MSERTPGVWRLRVMTSRDQIERIFRGSQTAAREALDELAAEKPSPTGLPAAGDESVRTFGQLLDKWLEHLRARDRAPKTLAENKREIETRIRPRLGAISVTVDNRRAPRRRVLGVADRGPVGTERSPSRSGHLRRPAAGVKRGWLEANPAQRASAPAAAPKRKLVTPGPDQVAKLIRAAEEADPIMATAVALAFITGGRRGELAALRRSDVDLDVGMVRIERRGKVRIRGVRFHDLRHAHVTQLLGASADATTVATRVGHASTRMTLDRHAHALPAGDVGGSRNCWSRP